jgi:hypothetical protein
MALERVSRKKLNWPDAVSSAVLLVADLFRPINVFPVNLPHWCCQGTGNDVICAARIVRHALATTFPSMLLLIS